MNATYAIALDNRWQRMETAPRDGTRILLAWEPYSGVSDHVELGKWKSKDGWCNTYGKPFSNEPDVWASLAPFLHPAPEQERAEQLVREAREVLLRVQTYAPDIGVDEFLDAIHNARLLIAKIDGAE